jgi:hypothetical protein
LLSIEGIEDKGGGPPRYNITELLQMCWPSLTEDCVASHTNLSQELDQTLQSLREALALPGTGLSAQEWINREGQNQKKEITQAQDSKTGLDQPIS